MVVEGTRGQTRRNRHALKEPGTRICHALGDRLLIDVDAIPVLGSERPRVARRLRESDQNQGNCSNGDRACMIAHLLPLGKLDSR